jgi:hypothetical protein
VVVWARRKVLHRLESVAVKAQEAGKMAALTVATINEGIDWGLLMVGAPSPGLAKAIFTREFVGGQFLAMIDEHLNLLVFIRGIRCYAMGGFEALRDHPRCVVVASEDVVFCPNLSELSELEVGTLIPSADLVTMLMRVRFWPSISIGDACEGTAFAVLGDEQKATVPACVMFRRAGDIAEFDMHGRTSPPLMTFSNLTREAEAMERAISAGPESSSPAAGSGGIGLPGSAEPGDPRKPFDVELALGRFVGSLQRRGKLRLEAALFVLERIAERALSSAVCTKRVVAPPEQTWGVIESRLPRRRGYTWVGGILWDIVKLSGMSDEEAKGILEVVIGEMDGGGRLSP